MGSYPLLKDTTGSAGGGGNFVPSSWTGSSTSQFAGTASYVSGSVFTSTNLALSASYALSASFATRAISSSYPISVIGSSLYSIALNAGVPSPSTANYSTFFGEDAGLSATNAGSSNFLGYRAGYNATNAYGSNFLGFYAGAGATNANSSNFLGQSAGGNATNTNRSNFLGSSAGDSAVDADQSNFLGFYAGRDATKAENSNFLGFQVGFRAISASYSTLLGYQVGYTPTASLSIGTNNIIIGTNITLSGSRKDSINIGGIIFGTGSHSDINATYPFSGSVNGRIGINIVDPTYSLHVSGTVAFPNLTNTAQTNIVTINTSTGQLFYTASSNIGGGGGSGVTINNNTNNNLVTATGTSNTLDGEANLTFDGSALKVVGNVTASSFTGSFTGSLLGTASYADTASAVNVTVSSNTDEFLPVIVAYTGSSDGAKLAYIDSGFQYNPSTNALYLPSNGALVAGNVTVSSNTSTFGSATAQNHTLNLTGSLNVTKSLNVIGSMSLNAIPTASFHISGTTILNGGNLVGLPFSSFTTVPTQITGNAGIRGILYVYPRSGDTSSVIFGGGGYQSWTLRSLGFNDFQIRSTSNENATPGPQVTLMHFSSGSNGEFRIGVLNETPEYTFDISGSARVTSSFYLPGLTTIPQSNVLTIDTTTGQVYYTASSVFASTDSNIFKGTQTFSGSLIPAGPYIDNTSSYNLGSPTAAWDKIYVSNNSLHFVSGSTSSSIGFNNGIISFNNATVTIPTGSTIPYTSTSSIIGDGINASYDINHGFNTRNLHITVYENFDNYETVYPDIRRINDNTASIVFANPVSAINQYVVYISQ